MAGDRRSAHDWDDGRLLESMLAHEMRAWREFHRRYDRLIYRCIQKVTVRFSGVLGSDHVAEIHASLLVALTARDMHKLRSFQPDRGHKLGSWIGLLATNAAWDHLRAIARQPHCTQLVVAESMRCAQPDACQRLLTKRRLKAVNEVLRNFSSRDRRFMRLYYVDGLSPEQVAEELGISIRTVYSKKHKIHSRLRRAIGRGEMREAA